MLTNKVKNLSRILGKDKVNIRGAEIGQNCRNRWFLGKKKRKTQILAQNRAKIRENPSKMKGRGAFRLVKNRFFKGGIFVEIQLVLKNSIFRSNQRILS